MRAISTHLTATGYMSGDPGTTITSPVGRIVWGHPLKPRPSTDNRGQPKLDKEGKQMMEVSFGLAIPIADFQSQVWPHMAAEIAKGFPQGIPGNFSYKMTQPHEIDNKGKPYGEREGYADHVVLAVSTVLEPPAAFRWNGSQWQQMQPEEIKTGDYVQVEINFKVNVPTDRTHTPSIYVNPRQIAFVGYGSEIKSGIQADPNAAFGAGPAPLPPGASATPIGGAPGVGMPGNGSVGAGAGMPVGLMPGAATVAPGASASPMQTPSAPGGMPGVVGMPTPTAPVGPQRPTDPTHIHNNGDGTEQWFINGAWDGGAHPVPAAAPAPGMLPPPATGFVDQAAGMPAPAAGMPGAMPPR